jgi:flagellar basal-body rod protein FlgC
LIFKNGRPQDGQSREARDPYNLLPFYARFHSPAPKEFLQFADKTGVIILEEVSGMTAVLNTTLSALDAYGKKLDVTANNIANVNTDGFKKSRATFQEADSSGVVVSISKVNTPGSPIPSEDGTGKSRESSNVDLAEEIVNLQTTKHGYQANLKTLKAEDEMLGSLFDILG